MIQLTPEQHNAVYAQGDSIAVVAGAGTGKTRVLTERFLHLVVERGIDLRRILAVTFTEKAAREMKQRIRDEFADRGDAVRARQVEFASISTIHAFLARVLRERALDAGVDPRFGVADEITAELLLEQAMSEAVEACEDPALFDLAGGEDFVRSLYHAARATPLALGDLGAADVDEEAFRARLDAFLDAAATFGGGGKTKEKIDELVARRAQWHAFDFDGFTPLLLRWSKPDPELKEELGALKKIVEAWPFRARAQAAGTAVVALLQTIDDRYAALKRDEGLVDFTDLERLGLQLLRSDAGPAVAADFDQVLVDEYQDTSLIQQALVDALAQGRERYGVGDQKQSIYRFRYADASIFRQLQESSDAYPLSGSFRSRPEVVRFVNNLFRDLFAETDTTAQDLHAAREWDDAVAPCVEVLSPEAERAPRARRREADALATRLFRLVEEEKRFRWGDGALLLPRMSNLPLYERALSDRGIPFVVVKGRGYYAAREVVELANLLLLLEDPSNRFRAVCVLTSLLCGVPEVDLLRFENDADLPLGPPRPERIPDERWARLETFFARFAAWQQAMGRVETGDLVERILTETRFADLMLLEPDGRRRHANLKKVLRQARATKLTAPEFARGLLEFREREVRESEAPIASEKDDALQIMTVHASKGLEFPFVAVADLTEADPKGGRVVLRPDGVFGLAVRDGEKSGKPPGYAELVAWDREQERAEERRLWYVAMTRAEQHLILSWPRANRSRNNALESLRTAPPEGVTVLEAETLQDRTGRRGFGRAVRAAVRRGADLPAELPRDDAAADAVLARVQSYREPVVDEVPYIAAVADLVEFDRCPRRYRLRRMLGIELESPPPFEGGEAPDSDEHPRRILGTAFHKVVAEVGAGEVPDEATVRLHFPEARPQDVTKIIEWASWFADQPLAAELRATKSSAEMDFLVRVGGLPLRGTIDLYARGLPLLLDWKTSREPKPEQYALQVAIYLQALRELELPCPEKGHLVYVDAQEIHEVEPVPLEPLLERFRAAHRSRFEPTPGDACRYCDFRSACETEGHDLPSQ
ncbi:MAG: UvrD-helicase domain-containing protein [Planctomycetota bacterium]